jgi:hypothetical protein
MTQGGRVDQSSIAVERPGDRQLAAGGDRGNARAQRRVVLRRALHTASARIGNWRILLRHSHQTPVCGWLGHLLGCLVWK